MRLPAGGRRPRGCWGSGRQPPSIYVSSLQIFAEGALPPPSGAIAVNGRNLQTEASSVRAQLGACPQRDVLFDPLTALEHLPLFSSLKAPRGARRELRGRVCRWVAATSVPRPLPGVGV